MMNSQLLIGLASAGKTTFLAALWHLVDFADVDLGLKLKSLHGNREHLNDIRKKWLNCQELDRTKMSSEKMVSMVLEDTTTGICTELVLPDMSGESFLAHWKERKWPAEYQAMVENAKGVLLFVHPEHVVQPIRIDAAIELIGQIAEGTAVEDASEESISWDPEDSPTQVILVDFLQLLQTFHPEGFKVSVIVSAWDLLRSLKMSPTEWLKKNLPLLHQYLLCNSSKSLYRIYGLSAQGGDTHKDKEKLCSFTKSSERIEIIGEDCKRHDITAPLKWIIQ